MINTNKLKGIMVEKGYTGEQLAKVLGISSKTFYSKMKKRVFGSDEIQKMVKVLEIENPTEVFFTE